MNPRYALSQADERMPRRIDDAFREPEHSKVRVWQQAYRDLSESAEDWRRQRALAVEHASRLNADLSQDALTITRQQAEIARLREQLSGSDWIIGGLFVVVLLFAFALALVVAR